MTLAGTPFAESTLAGVAGAGLAPAPPESGGPPPTTTTSPFTVEINGQAVSGIRAYSLRIDVQLGRQSEASFELVNLAVMPEIGQSVRILYFSEVLFAGTLDDVTIDADPSGSLDLVSCSCTDHSYLLFRRKIKKAYVNQTIAQIATTLANSELLGDGVTVGTVDVHTVIPVANADWVSIFEFLSELAQAVGAMFYVDYEKKMHFISGNLEASGTALTTDNIETVSIRLDRETYRNQQTTTVTGTSTVSTQDALVVELTRNNQEQILQRNSIEQTTGIYNEHVAVTHPSSNDPVQLARLAQATNKIGLGMTGSIRRSLSVRTRQYGYRVGQIVSMTMDRLGISGTWVIQRMQLQEEAGLFVVATLELNQATLIRRQQELWLDVVRKGTVAVMPPSSVYANTLSHTTPGLGSWQVPAGVTEVQITCYGGGGGGGGGARSEWPTNGPLQTADGSGGGSGGLSITILPVTPGEVLTFWVGIGGAGGAGQYRLNSPLDAKGADGGSGITSYVERSGGLRVGQANGGNGGIGGLANVAQRYVSTLPPGLDGQAFYGQFNTLGGTGNRGLGGFGYNNSAGAAGGNGKVVMEW